MPVGLQVLNPSSNIQIDETFSNYQIVASGSATSRTTVNYPHTGDRTNLVFARAHSNGALVCAHGPYPGGTFPLPDGIWPVGNYFVPEVLRPSPGLLNTLDYFVAARNSASPAVGNFGLQTFAPASEGGGLIFDSNRNYLKIQYMGAIRIGDVGDGVPPTDITLPSPPAGKKYYTCINWATMIRTDYQPHGDGSAEEWIYGVAHEWLSPTQLRVHPHYWYSYDPEAASGTQRYVHPDSMTCILVGVF